MKELEKTREKRSLGGKMGRKLSYRKSVFYLEVQDMWHQGRKLPSEGVFTVLTSNLLVVVRRSGLGDQQTRLTSVSQRRSARRRAQQLCAGGEEMSFHHFGEP